MSPEAWRVRVQDMLDALTRIERLTAGMTVDEFGAHPSVFPAVLHYLTVIGEAATRMPDEIARRYAALPWAEMRAQRNFIVHRYGDIDPEIIWDTIQSDLPLLRPQLETILNGPL